MTSSVSSGTRLGPYEVLARIGKGGMGEVFRARDTRLERNVAIKVLPVEFAADAQLRLRFDREAKTISQFNHPNICTLHDVGREGDIDYLVMELIEGETLADRIARAPLSIEEVVRYGVEIARALHRAHTDGVIHRDLKPGNVMLTREGAKLLDFGLATWAAPVLSPDAATIERSITAEGVIIGTFQYMSPEQLAGQQVDHRSDIFTLGTVLYEMATRRRAFRGETKASLIAAIMGGTPEPLSQLQPLAPLSLEHVIERCLEKDPRDRWQSANDVAQELKWAASLGSSATIAAPVAMRRKSREKLAWALAALAVAGAAAGAAWLLPAYRASQRVMITNIAAPEKIGFVFDSGTGVLSPDGTRIAFIGVGDDGPQRLWVRSLQSPSATPLAGTEGATFPFWSWDSRSLGFFTDNAMRKIAADGGPVETIAAVSLGRGGSWASDGTIIYTPSTADPLFSVSAMGGEPRAVTKLDPNGGFTSHRFPSFAPDGRHFVFFGFGRAGTLNVLLGSLDGGPVIPLLNADGGALFDRDGDILYIKERLLRAQRVDVKKGKLVGESVVLGDAVQGTSTIGFVNFSVSATGILSYVSGAGAGAGLSRLQWLDGDGKKAGEIGKAADHFDPRVSHDGSMVMYSQADERGNLDVWSYDVKREVTTRLTFTDAIEFGGAWSPDDRSVAYTSLNNSPGDIWTVRTDQGGAPQLLVTDRRRKLATDWSADGRYLLFHAMTPATHWDIDAWSFSEKKIIPVLHTQHSELAPHLSPNGAWLAYSSDESGTNEIYVQGFPNASGRWQVSSGGGSMPAWSHDGSDIYYYSQGKIMAASVHPGPAFSVGVPRLVANARIRFGGGVTRNQYDVAPDGKLLANVTPTDLVAPPITLVQNWTRLMRAGK